jgi:3-oxoacyl-[acyl-carrier-protein] synthase-3
LIEKLILFLFWEEQIINRHETMYATKIRSVGHYLPPAIVTNADLENMMDTSDEWIRERTGIEERRWIEEDDPDTTSSMGLKAAKSALEKAGMEPEELDFIIFCTLSPDYYFPGCGVLVQRDLGIDTIGALDVRNQCSGFIYGLSIADQFIKTGMYRNILLIGSEIHSTALDKSDHGRDVSVIFGDGAGAVILSRAEEGEGGVLSTCMHSQGEYAEELAIINPSTKHWVDVLMRENDPEDRSWRPYMNGNFVFKHAVSRMGEAVVEALQVAGKKAEDIDLLIAHQANLRIIQLLQNRMGLSDDRVFNNIMKVGNTTAGSIPIAMSQALEQGKLSRGDLLCLVAFGAGFTWGAALVEF